MDLADEINAIKPLKGKIVPIRTIYQTNPPEAKFAQVYVVEIHTKSTSKVVHLLNRHYPRNKEYPLNHMKRFAAWDALPPAQQNIFPAPKPGSNGNIIPTLFGFIPPHAPEDDLPDAEALQELLAPYVPGTYATKNEPDPSNVTLYKIQIPFTPPFTKRQSDIWNKTIWPMSWNPSVPKSTTVPPPQLLETAYKSINSTAGYYLALAKKVAESAKASGRGRGVGAVIVDPNIHQDIDEDAWREGYEPVVRWMNTVIAVGEDARFARSDAGQPSQLDLHPGESPNPACLENDLDKEGGPDLHAMMRGVELVARCRRLHADEPTRKRTSTSDMIGVHTDPQLCDPDKLSPLEEYFLNKELFYSALGPSIPISAKIKSAWDDIDPPVPPAPPPKKRKPAEGEEEFPPWDVDPPKPKPPPPKLCRFDSPEHFPTDAQLLSRAKGGYLCAGLDIYLSHEPCLACSMGLILSRFRAVVIPRSGRMNKTGGIMTEPIPAKEGGDDNEEEGDEWECHPPLKDQRPVYYGMHYRQELNWRTYGFEFVESEEKAPAEEPDSGVDFHA